MPKERGTKRKNEDHEYEVQNILASRINSENLLAEFRVRWTGYTIGESTWEPLDSLYKLPILIKDFVDKEKKSLARRIKDHAPKEITDGMSPFKPIPEAEANKFLGPGIFLPVGDEELVQIQGETMSTEGHFLWTVVFKEDMQPCLVRKQVVCYYWPFEACMYMNRQVEMAQKLGIM